MKNPILQWYYKIKHRGGLIWEWQDKNDYVLGWSFGTPYQPKSERTNNEARLLGWKNQKRLNTCVVTSGTTGKEPDEGVFLDEQVLVNYLVSRREMNSQGTSLSYFQNALRNYGIPARITDPNYDQSFDSFAEERNYKDFAENAAIHKIASSYKTTDLNQVLRELDNGRLGHAGGDWYTGYNDSGLNDLAILEPYKGYKVGGHATLIVDYDLNYHGYKVLKVRNSYSKEWGINGNFYVKFEDFNKIFAAVYFNSDLPKDVVSWLSLNQGKLVKEKNSPKIYLIDNDRKRHIPDEAYLWMMEKPFEEDNDNMLPQVQEGDRMQITEIPPERLQHFRTLVAYSKDQMFMKDRFQSYFPELYS